MVFQCFVAGVFSVFERRCLSGSVLGYKRERISSSLLLPITTLILTGYGPTEHGEAAALRHRLWACILGAQLITAEGKSVKIGGGESSQEKIGIVGQLSISIA